MHLKVSQNFFVFIAFVLFTLLHAVAMETGGFLSTLSYTLKPHHKIFNFYKIVNFYH